MAWISVSLTVCALALSLLIHLPSLHGKSNPTFRLLTIQPEPVFEDGYTVTTVIDGHKLGINPHSAFLPPQSSDLIVLDSSRSAFFTVPFPISQVRDGIVKRLTGNGEDGYSDGPLGTARFSHPRSFAIDLKGNIYVADKYNHVIRKISDSGVTTIAGGNTFADKPGHKDGPAQNATFSNDFELVFIAEGCALLVSDHGNQLVRQINLKLEDCRSSGGSKSAIGGVWIWSVGVGIASLIGFIVGIAVGPYIISYEGSSRLQGIRETWKRRQIPSAKLIPMACFAIRSAVANTKFPWIWALLDRIFWVFLSHISLLFTTGYHIVFGGLSQQCTVSLLECDNVCSFETTESDKYANQLKDLITFDGSMKFENAENNQIVGLGAREEKQDIFKVFSDSDGNRRIDSMIEMHEEVAKETTLFDEALFSTSGLVKRR